MLLIRGALSSGAVSSSWIWNLLTAVFTVTSLLASGSIFGAAFRFTEPLRGLYFTFSRLLTCRKLYLVLRTLSSWSKSLFSTRYTSIRTSLVHWATVAPSQEPRRQLRHGRATPQRR